MKIYNGRRDRHGTHVYVVDGSAPARKLPPRLDVAYHSPSGFEWGFIGSGPAQLALAILCDALGDQARAKLLYQSFKVKVIAALPQRIDTWTLAHDQVMQAVGELEAERVPVQ